MQSQRLRRQDSHRRRSIQRRLSLSRTRYHSRHTRALCRTLLVQMDHTVFEKQAAQIELEESQTYVYKSSKGIFSQEQRQNKPENKKIKFFFLLVVEILSNRP